jgi:hypothetical protein
MRPRTCNLRRDIAAGEGLVLVLVPEHPFGAGVHGCPGERESRCRSSPTALDTLQSLAPLARTFGDVARLPAPAQCAHPVFTGESP